jgi:mevalonate pyrophosphate decarboxylase
MKATAVAHPVQDLTHTILSQVSVPLPFTGSVAVATHPLKTTATVAFQEDFQEEFQRNFQKESQKSQKHAISINGIPPDQVVLSSITTVVSRIKTMAGIEKSVPYRIVCTDTSPWFRTSSGVAAITVAAAHAAGLDLSQKDLSSIVRKGNVYAPHSVTGYFSQWKSGLQPEFSHSVIIDDELDMGMVAVFTEPVQGIHRITPADEPWLKIEYSNLYELVQAIKDHDVPLIGVLAEQNSIIHQAHTLESTMGVWQPDALRVMAEVTTLRQEKVTAYYSVGNGVVYINSYPEEVPLIYERIKAVGLHPVCLSVGGAARTITDHLF